MAELDNNENSVGHPIEDLASIFENENVCEEWKNLRPSQRFYLQLSDLLGLVRSSDDLDSRRRQKVLFYVYNLVTACPNKKRLLKKILRSSVLTLYREEFSMAVDFIKTKTVHRISDETFGSTIAICRIPYADPAACLYSWKSLRKRRTCTVKEVIKTRYARQLSFDDDLMSAVKIAQQGLRGFSEELFSMFAKDDYPLVYLANSDDLMPILNENGTFSMSLKHLQVWCLLPMRLPKVFPASFPLVMLPDGLTLQFSPDYEKWLEDRLREQSEQTHSPDP